MKLSLTTLALTGLAVVTLTPIVRAQELVTNGGFETSNFTGWTTSIVDNTITNSLSYVHTGAYGISYGAVGFDAPLSQTLNTAIGATETITFWQHELAGTPNEVALTFGGVRLLTLTDLPQGPWTRYTATATATSASTVLTLGLRQDPAFSAIDDISVVQSAVPDVPEPGSMALLASLGLTGIGFLRRRRMR